jgi:hypothetical protein
MRTWPGSTSSQAPYANAINAGSRLVTLRGGTSAIIVLCSVVMVVLGLRSEQGINIYARQAESFLRLQLAIPDFYHDLAVYQGRFYLPLPLFPAVLLMPGVLAWGASNALPILMAVFLTALSIRVFWSVLRHLALGPDVIFWSTVAFFFGTGYWQSVMWSWGAWYFAHVVATLCLLLAMHSALVGQRAATSGLLLGLGYLSRPLLVFPAFFLMAVLWDRHAKRGRLAQVGSAARFGLVLGLVASVGLLLNWMRFDDAFQFGYQLVPHRDVLKLRIETHGLFSLAYLPFNFVYMFLQGPHIEFTSPDALRGVAVDQYGTSLTLASPFLVAAFWARWKRPLVLAAWLSIAATVGTLLVYFNNGFVQANFQRYTLDAMPVLMVLVAIGVQRRSLSLWRALVVYAIGLNVVTLLCVPLWQMLERTS